MGISYEHKGAYDKASEYYFKALAIREKVFGTEHIDTATIYNNIGNVYDYMGDHDKALGNR
ncbi:MAG: tetratricopeptide repeat protein [Oscillospiraceae bacterium]|nr:tetratricopeptide repeat protein [Oscillospiraceae bacterium]